MTCYMEQNLKQFDNIIIIGDFIVEEQEINIKKILRNINMVNMVKGPTWPKDQHGQRTNMVKGPTWSKNQHGQRTNMVKEQTWSKDQHGQRTNMVKGPISPAVLI